MIDDAISTLGDNEHPLVHTDRGCHYRWPGWITRMDNAGLQRSMSKKGCSPDNSACEGLFGRLKNEMFYSLSWIGVSVKQFIEILNNYLIWYNEVRIKNITWEYESNGVPTKPWNNSLACPRNRPHLPLKSFTQAYISSYKYQYYILFYKFNLQYRFFIYSVLTIKTCSTSSN